MEWYRQKGNSADNTQLLQIQNFTDETCLKTNLTIMCFLALCAKNP
jgi:hypothetical protein